MTMLARLIGLALLATCTGALQPSDASDLGIIRMSVDDGDQMTIQIKVNEREGPGVLDTAATYAMIDANMLTDINSEPRTQQVSILGLSGPRLFPTAQIGPVSTGEIDLSSMPAAINAQARFPGHKSILPASAFAARVIDFDFVRNRIELYDSKPKSPGDVVLSKLSYTEIEGLPFIPVKLNGKQGLALIDTGSDATYINGAFAKLAGTRPQPELTLQLLDANASATRVSIVTARRLKMGKHSMQNFNILSADPPLFEHLGLTDQPIMVLGLDTLRNFRLQIDRERKHVYLGRPESHEEGRRYRVQPFSSRIRPDEKG